MKNKIGFQSLAKEDESVANELKETCIHELQLSAEDAAKVKSGDLNGAGPNVKVNGSYVELSFVLSRKCFHH